MAIDPRLRNPPPECLSLVETPCDPATLESLQWANAAFITLAGLMVGLTAYSLGGGFLAGAAACAAVVLNLEALEWRRTAMSDYLALLVMAFLIWQLVRALKSPSTVRWGCVGLGASLLVLVKTIFLYLLPVGAIAGLAALLLCRKKREGGSCPLTLRAGLVATLVAALPILGWMGFNAQRLGDFSIASGGRTSFVLSEREGLNRMTSSEYAVAWLWHTRGIGDNIARDWLPERVVQRFNDNRPGGFKKTAQKRQADMIADYVRNQGMTEVAADRKAARIFLSEMAERPFTHIAVSAVLFYRGLWIDEFILLSFPALLWLLFVALKRRQWIVIAIAVPGLYSLCLYPLVSPGDPRFQLTTLPLLAIALGLAAQAVRSRYLARRSSRARATAS